MSKEAVGGRMTFNHCSVYHHFPSVYGGSNATGHCSYELLQEKNTTNILNSMLVCLPAPLQTVVQTKIYNYLKKSLPNSYFCVIIGFERKLCNHPFYSMCKDDSETGSHRDSIQKSVL